MKKRALVLRLLLVAAFVVDIVVFVFVVIATPLAVSIPASAAFRLVPICRCMLSGSAIPTVDDGDDGDDDGVSDVTDMVYIHSTIEKVCFVLY